MEIKRQSVHKDGACNFCDQSKLGVDVPVLLYPYKEVTQITGTAIRVNMCDGCFAELSRAFLREVLKS